MRSIVLCASVITLILAIQTASAQPLRQLGLFSENQTGESIDSIEASFDDAATFARLPGQKPVSVATATTLAIFPGVLFHGIGHLYARDPKTGFVLLGIDLVSKGVFFFESLKGLSEGFKDPSETVLWTCVVVNAAAWLYDIGHAGVAANNYNERFRFSVKIRDGAPSLVLTLNIDK